MSGLPLALTRLPGCHASLAGLALLPQRDWSLAEELKIRVLDSTRSVTLVMLDGWRRVVFSALLASLAVLPGLLSAAANDNNVEWDGVLSLEDWREPRHPARGEAFTVELRVFRGDITGARVRTWDGASQRYDMSWTRNDGEHEFWRAEVAGTQADYLYYRFEVIDGSDTDYYNALGMWGDVPPRGDFLINTTALGGFPLGATVDGAGAVFRVWAPNAASVAVAGSFNAWSTTAHPLSSVQGFWQVRVPAVPAGSTYKFVIANGGQIWRTDPYARAQTNSVGDSVVNRSTHVWGDQGWVTPDFEDMIVYELHVGTFSGEDDGVTHFPGRYRDVADRHLGHLVDLGVNVVEIMPVGEFAGERSWGYNPSFQFAPESSYGSPDDLKYLVDRCHRAGIAVILDVVYNHMGATDLAGNLLDYDGEEIYFYPPGNGYRETPWGPRPDYGRVEVRNYLRENVRYWLEEFHLDGFRVDGTDFVKVNGEGWQLLKDIAQNTDAVSCKAIVIAEQLPNDPAVTVPISQGGAGHDAQWNDAFHDSLRAALGAAAFGDPNVGAVAAGLNHFGLPGPSVVNYIESHDEAANHGRVPEVADSSDPHSVWAYGRSKLAMGLVLFSAGIPMLLQGQEVMEDRRFGDDRTHRIQWDYKALYGDFFSCVRDMVFLRRSLPALRSSAGQSVFHVNESDNLLAWHRYTGSGDDLVIVASFKNSDLESYCLGFPRGGEWFEVLNSDAAAYGGRNHGNGGRINASSGGLHGFAQSACITVPRMGVLVFSKEPVDLDRAGFVRGDCNGDEVLDLSDAVRGLFRLFSQPVTGDCAAACDANGDGQENVSDPVFCLNFLFRRGAAPPAPWPACAEATSPLECTRRCP
jgi:1,4-alpha-glucan branching enzyme